LLVRQKVKGGGGGISFCGVKNPITNILLEN
jgi:hypothetical protein